MGIENFYAAHHTFCDAHFETHMHDCYELYLTLSENVYIETEQGIYNAGAGDVFIFPPFSFHKIIPASRNFERCLLHFDEQSLIDTAACLKPMIDFLKHPGNAHLKADAETATKLTEIFLVCIALRHGERGQMIFVEYKFQIAAVCNLHGVFKGFFTTGEQATQLVLAL